MMDLGDIYSGFIPRGNLVTRQIICSMKTIYHCFNLLFVFVKFI